MTELRLGTIDRGVVFVGIGAIGNANSQTFPRHGYEENRPERSGERSALCDSAAQFPIHPKYSVLTDIPSLCCVVLW